MKTIETLFNDRQFFTDLMKEHCGIDIVPSWIDEERSTEVTDALHAFLPDSFPFFTAVKAIVPPEDCYSAATVNCPRYIIISVLDESYEAYCWNYNYFHVAIISFLISWEICRSVAATSDMNTIYNISGKWADSLTSMVKDFVFNATPDADDPFNGYLLNPADPIMKRILDSYQSQ